MREDLEVAATEEKAIPVPRGPWSFLVPSLRGGGSAWGLHLLAGWLCFHVLTSTFWALHLKALAGWSGLPNYWGELITARDLWELVENGGLKGHWTGPWAPLAALAAMAWFLWAGANLHLQYLASSLAGECREQELKPKHFTASEAK